ncbi:MAG: DUF177 domain-containing protein [Candidatus Omnitrophica bacterium]|nr:DUF177 domain-containing protein [Candidatus Omnitrophota bacterium]MBU2251601.1 DUF177 domain-containing protein [Candidatus Omnitrophota bacterium]MBU2473992.1 DUF177 domain-containing protein [Candidatus Omnitrophota bacterium]
MKIAVREISDEKVRIQENIPASAWEMDGNGIVFVDSINIDCECFRAGPEIMVEAKVATQSESICSRCLKTVRQSNLQDFKCSYPIDSQEAILDLDKDIREEILLDFPMRVLCVSDCKGICPGCGVDLNSQSCKCEKK